MASEPNNARTMSDLMLRVAEKLGIAEYRSTGQLHIPVDQYNFNLCKRYIKNGISMFMADSPVKGWRWMRRICSVTFATRVTGTADAGCDATSLIDATLADTYDAVTDLVGWWIYILTGTGIGSYAKITAYDGAGDCTVAAWLDSDGNLTGTTPVTGDTFAITSVKTDAGDASKYILPANFGGTIDGKIEYAADTNQGTRIEWCDEATIRARRSVSVNSGVPTLAAIRPYQPMDEDLSQSRQWELIVDPSPDSTYTVQFPYTLYFDGFQMESGVATAGAATTLTDNLRTEAADYFVGWTITIVDGTNVGKYRTVTGYTAGGQFTFATMTVANDTTSQYIVEPPNNLHPAGHQHDDAVEAACLARTEMESQDEHFDTFWTDYYHKKAIPNAFKVDQRSAPRKLGQMSSGILGGRTRLGDSDNFTYLNSDGTDMVHA